MAWLQFKIETTQQHAELWQERLEEVGAAATLLLDAGDQPLLEPPPGATPLWDRVIVNGIFTADSDLEALTEFFVTQYGLNTQAYKTELLEDKDWERAWMDHYHPMRFGSRLWVVPSWCPAPDPDAVNLLLDPGLAFGTGTHATTALCLEWLDSLELNGCTVIDYGCGSGILAIAALLLGAQQAIAIDNDPQALISARNNAQRNGVAEKLQIYAPDEIPDTMGQADVIVANILAGPLIALAPRLTAMTLPGGHIALSGLIRSQVDDVHAAYTASFHMDPAVVRDEDWCRLSGKRR
ncbi:MAG: 50S ribosomal protein L11 methyltransferase [Pseudomonadales bacterium]|nr:50S ribosomal protein L11 methyltransferase [Pseudomonadales bacterium]